MVNIGIILSLSYLIIVAVTYFIQDSMLYFPEKEIWHTPKNINLEYSEIYFETEDGITISGWYIPAKNEKGVL
ncbi:MAG: hypothetical protein NTU69_10455, partial [Proteobacteria bacterium]|nr:hypothetical protein [Pseudomonadota bacterium]